jgi:calcineurin-like phosphoesterase family protein
MIEFEQLNFKIPDVYLTSDTHYAHKNICKATSSWDKGYRDFDLLQQMNNTIVDNINNVVPQDGLLIHCGDWSFGGIDKIEEFRKRIVCENIILIEGNHDHNIKKGNKHLFNIFTKIGYFEIENLKFVCCHYPMSIWHQSHKDVPLFYGHVHGSFENVGKSLDVGIDNVFKLTEKYKPIPLATAYEICTNKKTFLESHHCKTTN